MKAVIIISADIEWNALKSLYPEVDILFSPYGEYFETLSYLFFHGGWGKIAAAASTQYIINRWDPKIIINLGTYGGFYGRIEKDTIILVNKTIIYDIYESMGDPKEHIDHYSVNIDLSCLKGKYPIPIEKGLLVSADRDIIPDEIPILIDKYNAKAADWESGAIAWVCNKNNTQLLILRGVSDIVSPEGAEAYDGNIDIFKNNAFKIIKKLNGTLPQWLEMVI